MILENIPVELRERMQWVCWRYETSSTGKPTKVPYNPATRMLASVIDASTWVSFQQCVDAFRAQMFDGIGFVLTRADPYCIIDLDDKPEKPITPDVWALHQRILATFETYTEKSVSGRGYHIVMKGAVPRGLHRDSVEVYSDARYMAFTGDVTRHAPIVDCQSLLDKMISQMEPVGEIPALEQVQGKYTDAYICEMASNAKNADKYIALCNGDMTGYESQSEADYALLSMLTFYTLDNAQVFRLFRHSALGKRDKAIQDDVYLSRSVARIRSKMPAVADLKAAKENADAITKAFAEEQARKLAASVNPLTVESNAPARATPITGDHYPPGLVGDLTRYFFSTSERPVFEISLCAAICFVAGLAGRQFNISRTGLNQYVLLIAKTGTGKEGAASGINTLVAAVRKQFPSIEDYIGPAQFASGQGLVKVLDSHKSFVSILGEFGYTLQSINDPKANGTSLLLKRVLLDLYSKSGWNQVLRSTAYSDQEKNTKTVYAPSLTFLGESTPEMFYQGISTADIADGLIPRMQIVEYTGERPYKNPHAGVEPPKELVDRVATLGLRVSLMDGGSQCANVPIDPEALEMLNKFDAFCDDKIRKSIGGGEAQLWNRAHLKALKLAALLAVGVDCNMPVVTTELAEWACTFTFNNTNAIVEKFFAGEVGVGDHRQQADIKRLISEYLQYSKATVATYKVKQDIHDAGLVPFSYFYMRTKNLVSFYKDIRGQRRCLNETLQMMVDAEMLNVVDAQTANQRFGARQKLYSVGNQL